MVLSQWGEGRQASASHGRDAIVARAGRRRGSAVDELHTGELALTNDRIEIAGAAGVFSGWGLVLRPEMAALSMSGSSVIVAVNALMLKRLRLPQTQTQADGVAVDAASSNLHRTTV